MPETLPACPECGRVMVVHTRPGGGASRLLYVCPVVLAAHRAGKRPDAVHRGFVKFWPEGFDPEAKGAQWV